MNTLVVAYTFIKPCTVLKKKKKKIKLYLGIDIK